MIDTIIGGFIQLVIDLVSALLSPLDSLVATYLPSLTTALTAFQSFLSVCVSSIGWVISAVGIPSSAISLLIAYYSFSLAVPLIVYGVKLAIKWYHALMP